MEPRITHREGEVLHGVKAQAGERFMSFKVTLGGSPHSVSFEALGLPNMKDTDYRVFPFGEHAALGPVTSVDESTIATTGFDIINGAAAEVAHVLVHGNVDE